MPSGYTIKIYDNKNVTFKDFVLTCARAFGDCVHQRDDPPSDKPKTVEPDIEYYVDIIDKAKKFKKPTKSAFKKYIAEEIKSCNEELQKRKDLRNKYDKMMDEVDKWVPPTSEHQGLKDFMLQQLEDSIKWDCDSSFYAGELNRLQNINYDEYVKEQIGRNVGRIEYSTEKIEKEIQNATRINKWITALYESLS